MGDGGVHYITIALEEEVIGMRVGESKTFTLPPEKAFGSFRPELIGTVERNWKTIADKVTGWHNDHRRNYRVH